METQTVNKTDTVSVSEWNQLVNDILEDFEQDELQNVMYFYKESSEEMEIDNAESKKKWQQQFYDTIDCDEDKLQAAIKLQNVMRALQLHSVDGDKIEDKVQEVITRLKAYRETFEVETHQLFIGREGEVQLVTDILSGKTIVAVSLCGIGGQGKSLLARNVCKKLALSSRTLKIVKADLRNKPRLEDVIKSLLGSTGMKYPTSGGPDVLETVFNQYIKEIDSDLLFCLDDCDQVLKTEREAFMSFIQKVLTTAIGSIQKVRFLLTMREKLPSKDGSKKDQYTLKLAGQLAEVELCELEQSDAEDLLIKCSEVDIEKALVSGIVKECACSPLAVTVVAELLRSRKFTPERLLFHLQMDKKNVSRGLKVDHCIKEAIDNLNVNLQKALVCLSVFQSSPFEMSAARKMIEDPSDQIPKLYDCHLVEIEQESAKDSKKDRKMYSLHPLVFRFISEWKKPRELSEAYRMACQKFVSMYEGIISNVVKSMESKYWKGHRQLEFHRVHILKFYEIMSEHPKLLKDHPKKTDDKGLLMKKRVSDLADILLSLVQSRRMVQSEADRAIKQKNNAAYIFWMVEKADVFLMLHDKVEIALEILDELSNKYPALRDLRDEPYHPCFVHGLFQKVKGLCRWKQHHHQQALDHLRLSIKFYDKCQSHFQPDDKKPYDIFIARIKCYMGQVLLDQGDLDYADECLEEGHAMIKNMVKSRARETDELKEELHWDIPRYYYQFARIKLIKAKTTKDQHTREQLLDKALEDLEKGIKLDEQLKLDYLDGYLSKLKLRADVNVEKGLLKEALEDANIVLDKRRAILQPPHTHYTESVYQVGRIYMLIGNDLHKKGENDKAGRYWTCSSDYFKELKDCHLKDGGISIDNPVFQDIKRDHLQVTELTDKNQVKHIETFYRRVEAGDFKSEKDYSISAIKKMMWTPVEMMKKYFDGGGKEFGDNDQALTKMENLAIEQQERMMRGEPSGGARRDSGMGHSSSDDYGGSVSSGSGSMSERMNRLHLEKSVSIEDEVFQETGDTGAEKSTKRSKKRQKTIEESQED